MPILYKDLWYGLIVEEDNNSFGRRHIDNRDQTKEHVRFLLTDAIERQLISDVPLCTFLSGGLDSSIISNTAANYYKRKNLPLNTYSVNYTDNKKYFQKSLFQPNSDEDFIDIMVRHTGSKHHEVILDNTDHCFAKKSKRILRLHCRENVLTNFSAAIRGITMNRFSLKNAFHGHVRRLFAEVS